jgi:hypothetical protein
VDNNANWTHCFVSFATRNFYIVENNIYSSIQMELVLFPWKQWLCNRYATMLHYTYIAYLVVVEGSTVHNLWVPSRQHAQPIMILTVLHKLYWVTSVKVFLLKEFGLDMFFWEVWFGWLSVIKKIETAQLPICKEPHIFSSWTEDTSHLYILSSYLLLFIVFFALFNSILRACSCYLAFCWSSFIHSFTIWVRQLMPRMHLSLGLIVQVEVSYMKTSYF